MVVRDIMSKKVVFVEKRASLRAACALMERNKIHHLPVVSERKLVGIVSDKDIYKAIPSLMEASRAALIGRVLDTVTVEKIMSRPVKVVSPETEISEIANRFLKFSFRCFPVIAGGKLAGIVTITDILRYLAEGGDKEISIFREIGIGAQG